MATDPAQESIFVTPRNHEFYSRRKYKPLNPAKHEIRLLQIHPERLTSRDIPLVFPEWSAGNNDAADLISADAPYDVEGDFICCKLIEPVDLTSMEGGYAALSYCAGKPTNTKKIMIDGYWFNAFANLEYALEEYRSVSLNMKNEPGEIGLLWTDQTCIDQVNYGERSHQVGFMRKIYQQAEKTFVVLGTPDRPIRNVHGVALVQFAANSFTKWEQVQKLPGFEEWSNNETYADGLREVTRFFLGLLYKEPRNPLCEAFPQLLMFLRTVAEAQWWSRAWVFQEFVLSRQVYYTFGSQWLTLEELSPLLSFLHDNTVKDLSKARSTPMKLNPILQIQVTPNLEALKTIAEQCSHSSVSYELPEFFRKAREELVSALWRYEQDFFGLISRVSYLGFRASDPRDLIYAFSGLSALTASMVPDYRPSKSTWDVYIDVTERLLQPGRCYGIYYTLKRAADSRCGKVVVPSWVPDWSAKVGWTPSGYIQGYGEQPRLIKDPERSKWKILHVRGQFMSTVWEAHSRFEAETVASDTSAKFLADDEYWILNRFHLLFVLRRTDTGGYYLVGRHSLPGPGELKAGGLQTRMSSLFLYTMSTGKISWIDIF